MTNPTRSIAVVNIARSDYSILRPVMRAIADDPTLDLRLIVAGMHLSPEFGNTSDTITADGFEISDAVDMTLSSDSPAAISKSVGLGMIGFAQVFSRQVPDVLLLMGDRFEFFAAASAALPFRIPVAHIHGGELSEGAIDDAMRHAITKLSHLHFVATEPYAQRVIQLGEEPWRVTVSGAPGLDNLNDFHPLGKAELEARTGISLATAPVVATFHPETHAPEQTAANLPPILDALQNIVGPMVFTYPNADTAGRQLVDMIEAFCANRQDRAAVPNMGVEGYYSLLSHARAVVGNSSSGIIEAASFKLPVLNIGTRQQGRLTDRNVIHVAAETNAIHEGLNKVLSLEFAASLDDLINPYGDGHAARQIVARLRDTPIDDALLMKRFHDLLQKGHPA
jgi:UDP-hydrolysing UDP-N-acetyl-D-glucosamine 2-epimerase